MSSRGVDERILRLALGQHGAFTRGQADGVGATRAMVRSRQDRGWWLTLGPSLFALAGSAPTWERAVKAAELSVPSGVVSGRSALQLHGLPGGRRSPIELTVPAGGRSHSSLAILHRSDCTPHLRVDGIEVVTPEQAVIDVAGRLPFFEVESALDHGLLTGMIGLDHFRRRVSDLAPSRRPGIGTLRALLADRGDGFVVPTSELEARLYRLLARVGVPEVVRQASLPWRRGSRERVDALLPAWRLLVEGDGRRWHTRVRDFEADRRRDQEAGAHGYLVLRFTWGQLTATPTDVIDTIRATGRWRRAAA